jgi:hypothetical protein
MATKIAEKAKIREIAAKIKDENGKGTKIATEITPPQKRTVRRIPRNPSFLDISVLMVYFLSPNITPFLSTKIKGTQDPFCF